ncbi:Zinc finger CCCH domain-containing protein 59 [Platanthera guangdongensis]|uniref:Zinc finger CCCH domain-containing protein 59 n=1 Tax=Platanthera guangdongensis TaxID=2320717 RepID=A0ABR2MIS6_9ASPA
MLPHFRSNLRLLGDDRTEPLLAKQSLLEGSLPRGSCWEGLAEMGMPKRHTEKPLPRDSKFGLVSDKEKKQSFQFTAGSGDWRVREDPTDGGCAKLSKKSCRKRENGCADGTRRGIGGGMSRRERNSTQVLAGLLNIADRADWRNCKLSKEDELQMVENFKRGFENLDHA